MLGYAPQVVPTSSMDFPDSAQRFNWCNCQDSVRKARATLGATIAPPLVDFNFWNARLTGGGGATATPDPSTAPDPVSVIIAGVGGLSPWLVGAVAAAGVFMLMKGKGGKRR